MSEPKRTPLYEAHLRYGGKVVDYAGWALPVEYTGLVDEHEAVRNAAGLFDVSHMGEVAVRGKDAAAYVQNLVTNDITVLANQQVLYAMMCYANGGIVDDLLVYKHNEEHFFLVINAGNIAKDFQWMLDNKGSFDVELTNLSDSYAELAIQGPKAQEILQKLTPTDLNEIKFFWFNPKVEVAGVKCLVSRTGYTGEDGFEIYMAPEHAVQLWDKILEAGKEEGLKPTGLGCRDTLRFEASLPLYGNEINQDITPLEAGFDFFVKLDKDFIGREALVKQKTEGLTRKLVGFEMVGKGIARHGYEVAKDGQVIGFVTTGYMSPTLKKTIGLALVDIQYTKLDTEFDILIRNKPSKAVVIGKKFLKKQYKK